MNDLRFQKLTPTDEADLTAYEESFKFVFENDDICNVAISGPYGSGKSSVLETYKSKQDKKKFLHVYLTHFQDPASSDNQTDAQYLSKGKKHKEYQMENSLEGKILNQIIQQIPSKDVPRTAFRVKRHEKLNWCLCITIGIVIAVMGLLYLCCFDAWNSFVTSINDSVLRGFLYFTVSDWFHFIILLVVVAVLACGIYGVVHSMMKGNFIRRVNLLGNKVEILSDKKDSCFDKYLNEILYLFEKADVDAVVFEDIDRFDDVLIFERLREINCLINIRRQDCAKSRKDSKKNDGDKKGNSKEKPPIKFFYLMRDDIFSTGDRTKFFDFIMPVVPIVDGSNSYNKFKEYFEAAGLWEEIDHQFLKKLSLYFDDLRIVKNIVNEYVIFKKKLEGIELNPDKLLAMIVYKNIFPGDYTDLQLRSGYVFHIFSGKGKLLDQEKTVMGVGEERITELKEQIRQIDSEKEEDQEPSDSDRKKKELNDELKKVKSEASKIDNMTIAELNSKDPDLDVIRDPVESDFTNGTRYNEFEKNEYFPLLKFLIGNGYIDETYNDYMTFFYPGDLTNNDKIFLRSVFDRNGKDYTYHLDNTKLIFEYLEPRNFVRPEVLNFNLIDYLLSTGGNKDCLSEIVNQIKDTSNFDFLVSYYQATENKNHLVVLVNEFWPECFSAMYSEETQATLDILYSYSLRSLIRCNQDVLRKMDETEELSSYISSQPDYLETDKLAAVQIDLNDSDKEILIDSLQATRVKFNSICGDRSDPQLLDGVYQKCLYELNADNLKFFLARNYNGCNQEGDFTRCLTVLFDNPEEALSKYFAQNPEDGLSAALEITSSSFSDDERVVISVLNNENTSSELCEKYLNRSNTTITSLGEVKNKSFYPLLLNRGLIVRNAENIFSLFVTNEMSKELAEFVNSSPDELDYEDISAADEVKADFFQACVASEELDEAHFREIVSKLGSFFNKTIQVGLCEDKVVILAEEKMISMTSENLTAIRKNYRKALKAFICSDFGGYLSIERSTSFPSETPEILSCDEISEDDKLKFLQQKKSGKLSVFKSNNDSGSDEFITDSDKVITEILKNHPNINDLPQLCTQYDRCSESVKTAIFQLATKNVDTIIQSEQELDFQLLNRLISKEGGQSIYTKINLVKPYIEKLSPDDLYTLLISMGQQDIVSALKFEGDGVINNKAGTEEVLKMLKEKGKIPRFEKDKSSGNYRLKNDGGLPIYDGS